MSILQGRGGIPSVVREAFDATGRKVTFPFYTSSICARNSDNTTDIHMYFTEADFNALNTKYVVVPQVSGSSPYGEWSGPVEADAVWIRGDGGSATLELVVFQRRG